MSPSTEYTDGHLRPTRGEEYAEDWRGQWVVEMCGAWHGSRLSYARPDYVERGMGAALEARFPSRKAALSAIANYYRFT